jgi:hypothetical protein
VTTIDRARRPLVTTYDREACSRVIVVGPDAARTADAEPANMKAPPAVRPPAAPPAAGEPPTSAAVVLETLRRPVAPDTTATVDATGLPRDGDLVEDDVGTADVTAFGAEDAVVVTGDTASDTAFVTVDTGGVVGGVAGSVGAGAGAGGGGGVIGTVGTVVGTVGTGTGTGVVTVGTVTDVGSGTVGSPSASAPPATAPPPSRPIAVTAAAAFTRV